MEKCLQIINLSGDSELSSHLCRI